LEADRRQSRSSLSGLRGDQAKFARHEYLLEIAAGDAQYRLYRDAQYPEIYDVRLRCSPLSPTPCMPQLRLLWPSLQTLTDRTLNWLKVGSGFV
jgi:hypothetical protein